MKDKPINLQLHTIKFPLTAIVSILHRISGVILFVFIPVLLWALGDSLNSAYGFQRVQDCFSHPLMKLILWGLLTALAYHVIAGVRHLLADWGMAETKQGSRVASMVVIALIVIVAVILGIWVW